MGWLDSSFSLHDPHLPPAGGAVRRAPLFAVLAEARSWGNRVLKFWLQRTDEGQKTRVRDAVFRDGFDQGTSILVRATPPGGPHARQGSKCHCSSRFRLRVPVEWTCSGARGFWRMWAFLQLQVNRDLQREDEEVRGPECYPSQSRQNRKLSFSIISFRQMK
jgi:hypothetical protein